MSTLPKLKTGAVMQYPAAKDASYSTGIVKFVDGAEQRYRDFKAPLRRWIIRLDLLDEAELSALEDFFLDRDGRFGSFTFVEPWTETEYPNCSLDSDKFESDFVEEMRGRTTFVVRENRA